MNDGTAYPDQATFNAELDRLTGVCLRIRQAARRQGIGIETAARQATDTGMLSPEDYEIVSRVFLGSPGGGVVKGRP